MIVTFSHLLFSKNFVKPDWIWGFLAILRPFFRELSRIIYTFDAKSFTYKKVTFTQLVTLTEIVTSFLASLKCDYYVWGQYFIFLSHKKLPINAGMKIMKGSSAVISAMNAANKGYKPS